MHEPPRRAIAPEHERHPQRPVLGREIAHLTVLVLHDNEHSQVAGGVRLDDLEVHLAGFEEPLELGDLLGRVLGIAGCAATERPHEREVVGVVDQVEVPLQAAADERRRGVGDERAELVEVGGGHALFGHEASTQMTLAPASTRSRSSAASRTRWYAASPNVNWSSWARFKKRWRSCSHVNPMPPCTCKPDAITRFDASLPQIFAVDAATDDSGSPAPMHHAAQ